jgi:hypothetical protein
MFALFGAKCAAVHSAGGQPGKSCCRTVVLTAATSLLSASMLGTVALAGKDPADPGARVAGVHYRSTIAPYTSLRPSMPKPWRQRNESATPRPKQDH